MWVVEGFWRCSSPQPLATPCQDPQPTHTHSRGLASISKQVSLYSKLHRVAQGRVVCARGPPWHICCRLATKHPRRDPATSAWPQHLMATHSDGVARNVVCSFAGTARGLAAHSWGRGWWQRPHPTSHRGGRALPLSPSNHERQEQCVSGSDWFAPVASLQAPRDSSAGIAVFLKGHL